MVRQGGRAVGGDQREGAVVMDGSTGGNGRLAGSKGRGLGLRVGGRPTCDEVYGRVAGEYLRGCGLGPDDDFASQLARRFKEAPARVCCRSIGGWVDARLVALGWTQQDLAGRVGVDRSAVARWTAGGAISLGHLVLVLIEFGADLADLPVPARAELALEGYLAALAVVRQRLDDAGGPAPASSLDREGFWCLYHLLSEPDWERAVRREDRDGLRLEAERVYRKAGASLGRPPGRVRGVEGLRALVDAWAVAWVVCLHLLPGSWPVR